MSAITDLSATEIAVAIRSRRFSSAEALDAFLRRIERLNPAINAIVTMTPQAEADAVAADEAVAAGRALGPLHGVPITIKDCFETAGLRTTNGYEGTANNASEHDAPTVATLRAAGAVIIGKTNLPVLAGDSQTDNPVFGRTNNPWNLGTSPGGSSGGESAALAARLTPLGLGSDIGGSIRQPSHCTGIFGIKPTEHLVSTAGYLQGFEHLAAERHMNGVGPMARSVADLDLGLRIIAGPDRQFLEPRPVTLGPLTPPPIRGLRVAWATTIPGTRTPPEIRAGIEGIAAELARLGAQVEQALPPGIDGLRVMELWGELYFAELGASMEPEAERADAADHGVSADSPDPLIRGWAHAINSTLRQHTQSLVERDRLAFAFERFFDDWDVFICPPSPSPAPVHSTVRPDMEVDGVMVPYSVALDPYCMLFNITGHPGVIIPLGVTRDGLPFGAQLVGRRWSDIELLGIAETLSQMAGPCGVPAGYA